MQVEGKNIQNSNLVQICYLIVHPNLLVRVTCKWFLSIGATFGASLASESHWMQACYYSYMSHTGGV